MSAIPAKRLPPSHVDCKWWLKGYCSRGKTCHFKHDAAAFGSENKSAARVEAAPFRAPEPVAESSSTVSPETCAICYETPDTYGLLVNCDHAFCLECIRRWRSSAPGNDEDDDYAERKQNSKKCPMCRAKNDFIIPSSIWPSAAQKKDITEGYLGRLKTIPCRYFEESIRESAPHYRFRCPFTNHCHYSHIHPDTQEPYTFPSGELSNRRGRIRRHGHYMDDLTMMELLFDSLSRGSFEDNTFVEVVGFAEDDSVYDYAWE